MTGMPHRPLIRRNAVGGASWANQPTHYWSSWTEYRPHATITVLSRLIAAAAGPNLPLPVTITASVVLIVLPIAVAAGSRILRRPHRNTRFSARCHGGLTSRKGESWE